ncbi:MAG: RNA polymerase subunit sigma-70, partial [Phycisphaerae bacterium]
MPYNLATIAAIRARDTADFEKIRSGELSEEERNALMLQIEQRRRRSVTLLEELSLRTQRLQPCMKRLEQISHRMMELQEQIRNLKNMASAKDETRSMQKELDDLMALTMETPDSLAARMESILARHAEYEKAM